MNKLVVKIPITKNDITNKDEIDNIIKNYVNNIIIRYFDEDKDGLNIYYSIFKTNDIESNDIIIKNSIISNDIFNRLKLFFDNNKNTNLAYLYLLFIK